MRRIRYDYGTLARGRGGDAPRRRGRFGVGLFAFGLAAVALLVLSRLDHSALREVRWRLTEWLAPLMSAAAEPLEPVRRLLTRLGQAGGAVDELERLRAVNRRLRDAESRALLLERRVADLEALARILPARPAEYRAARVIATASGAFARSVVIDAGRDSGVVGGLPVTSGDGVVGRVVETGRNAARVLLLTDQDSRIPVEIGARGQRAVMTGDLGPAPRLEHLARDAGLADGDEVVTSGVGGLFPRGLRIGRVVKDGERWRVAPDARLDDLQHLLVLVHATPALDLYAEPPAPQREGSTRRPLAGAPPAGGERVP